MSNPSQLQKSIKVAVDNLPKRVKPVSNLSPDQETEFNSIVNRFPADYFGAEVIPLLEQLVRHIVRSRDIDGIITDHAGYNGKGDKEWVEMYDRLAKMAQRESAAIASLSTKLRITNQATTNHRGHRIENTVKKPWEV